MTLMQQQRLIGALLLVCVFSGIAYFLMSSATPTQETNLDPNIIKQEETFSSGIEVLPDDIEVLKSEDEALIDPHNLNSVETALNKAIIPETIEKTEEQASTDVLIESNDKLLPSWYLQLASFSIEKNAQTLKKQALSLGYNPSITTNEGKKGKIYRVRIGPDTNKSTLEKASHVLSDKLKLSPQIIQNTQ